MDYRPSTFLFYFLFIYLMAEVCIASLNVNGARNIKKRAELFEIVRQKRIDVTLVQETHSDVKIAVDWMQEWDGVSILSHNTSLSGGVGILFSRSFCPISYSVDEIIGGRLLKVKAVFENYVFVFICVYAPTSAIERISFLEVLNSTLKNCCSEDYLFLGGDFNYTERNIDRNHMEPHMPSRISLAKLIQFNELQDIWRHFHNDQRQYTWAHAHDNVVSLARLDRFYGFKHQLSIFTNCVILPVCFSHHQMVLVSFLLNHVKPQSAYWHFNTSLLCNKDFKDVFIFLFF